jgi:hypothetical protein
MWWAGGCSSVDPCLGLTPQDQRVSLARVTQGAVAAAVAAAAVAAAAVVGAVAVPAVAAVIAGLIVRPLRPENTRCSCEA